MSNFKMETFYISDLIFDKESSAPYRLFNIQVRVYSDILTHELAIGQPPENYKELEAQKLTQAIAEPILNEFFAENRGRKVEIAISDQEQSPGEGKFGWIPMVRRNKRTIGEGD